MTVVVAEPTAELGDVADLSELTAAERRRLAGGPEGTPFQYGDRLFGDWNSGDVFDYGDPNARGIDSMLDTDGTARQLEQVLTLPLRGAKWSLQGGSAKGRELIMRNIPKPQMDLLIAQQTSAIAFRKAFFELSWSQDGASVHLDSIGFRPATSCQAAFDQQGRPIGFRQRVANPGGYNPEAWRRLTQGEQPGWIRIRRNRSYIYTHGVHRQPLKGISDLSVVWWAYETRKKLMFLWLQYLETQSLPKVLAYGKDATQALKNAKAIAALKASGVAPVERLDDPAAKAFEILESSGKGSEQFQAAAVYLESHMTDSVLAGFTKLSTGAAAGGRGSQALSSDASGFFLQSRQGVADEIGLQTSTDPFAKVCIYNGLGPDDVPNLVIPLSGEGPDRALDMLKTIISTPQLNAPDEFVDSLLVVVAPMLELDPAKLEEAVTARRRQLAEQQPAAAPGDAGAGGIEQLPGPPSGADAELANGIGAVHDVYQLAQLLGDPEEAVRQVVAGARVGVPHEPRRRPTIDLAQPKPKKGPVAQEHTGGMICLVPDAASAKKLVLTGDGAEPLDQLHLTLAYLGDDVTGWDDGDRDEVLEAARSAIDEHGSVIDARAFGHTTFNPDGGPDGDRSPCAVYTIGDSDRLVPLQGDVVGYLQATDIALPRQHQPFVPHITATYSGRAQDLTYTGPVRFDRLAVVLGGQWTYLPLNPEENTNG